MFRWFALAILLVAMGVSGYHRGRSRIGSETIRRRREGGVLLACRALVALPLFLAVVAHVVTPQWMRWATFEAPEWVRWVGLPMGLLTVPAVHWVLSSLGRNVSETVLTKQQHELVTIGPYRWVRHPLYTTGIVLFLALGLMLSSWFVLLFALIVLILIRAVVIPLEERALLNKFGDQYRSYSGSTGRLLPRVAHLGS